MLSQQEMNRFNRRLAAVEKHLQAERRLAVGYVEVLTALMAVLGEKNPEIICAMDLPETELLRLLGGYPFDAPEILGEIEDAAIEVPGSIRRVYAALNRGAGSEWEILRHGSDPFPSNPSAHNEVDDIDLDLATGSLYHDREFVHRLRRGELIRFRDKIAAKYPHIALPPLAQ
jgi:hypothetical protein